MYYPKSKIISDLYTDNSEFIYVKNGKTYKGYYYSTYDGKFFTGKTYSLQTEELLRLQSNTSNVVRDENNSVYNVINNKSIVNKSPRFKYIVPTENDYINGYFKRYFCNRVNGDVKTILEINEKQFNDIVDNVLYKTISIDWRISGNIQDESMIDGIIIPGVINTNINTLKRIEKELPGISLYISNPAQFYK